MKFLKSLFNTTTKKIVVITILVLLLAWMVLFIFATSMAIGLIKPVLWMVLVTAVLWIGIHFGMKAWKKRKRKNFDEKVAAKEGIEDRRQEWTTWTAELEKKGIDRYELPFYLLVGEPQSGKSVLLHNSDLHFPFGQDRLSGVGGTRGCDWWFTEEAVVLDLAGRLFTHEGGAADRLEFEAFLQLLYEFRPLCPANGVILVIPCDSLLSDTEDECTAKATKIQNALLTLTTQLQAQLPVYLVLTKGDQIFGFAEAVHRLDVEQRHQMFGWSRDATKIDTPFDIAEATQGFAGMIERARLLRSHTVASARIPEALPEIDRMYAFPHELEGMQANLENYLKRIFTASNITDRVFFRGMYLTSGLQSGVPIAKVCTDLFGQPGEADGRDLEALFSKQRAYFIKDVIRNRIFGERGLVRPTQGRVQQANRSAVIGYGISAAVILISILFGVIYLAKDSSELGLDADGRALAEIRAGQKENDPPLQSLLYRLALLDEAVRRPRTAYEEVNTDTVDEFKELYCSFFNAKLVEKVKTTALVTVESKLDRGLQSHDELVAVCLATAAMLRDVDFSRKSTREDLLGCLPLYTAGRPTDSGKEPLTLKQAFELRLDYGGDGGLLSVNTEGERQQLKRIARKALTELNGCLAPGVPTQPQGELGFLLAWMGAFDAQALLFNQQRLKSRPDVIEICNTYANSMARMQKIQPELKSGSGGNIIDLATTMLQFRTLGYEVRPPLLWFLDEDPNKPTDPQDEKYLSWPEVNAVINFSAPKWKTDSIISLSSFGFHFGSSDGGQTLFQSSESLLSAAQGEIVLGVDHKPIEELDNPVGLLDLAGRSLPLKLEDGALAGLGGKLRDIRTRRVGPPELQVIFLGECAQLSKMFLGAVTHPDAARNAFTEETPDEAAKPLSKALVGELSALHSALTELYQIEMGQFPREDINNWRAGIEGLLVQHLKAAGEAKLWAPALEPTGAFTPDALALLEQLEALTKLQLQDTRSPLRANAGSAMRDCFLAMADRLADRWQSRPADDLTETVRTARELAQVATVYQVRLGSPKELSSDSSSFRVWSRRVDGILYDRLKGIELEVRSIWHVEFVPRGSLQTVVDAAERELATIEEKIDQSGLVGLNRLAEIVEALETGGPVKAWLELPKTKPLLELLQAGTAPSSLDAVESTLDYDRLKTVLGILRSSASSDDKYLIEVYRDRLAVPPSGNPDNAGVALVRAVRDKVAERVRQEMRDRYLAELADKLDSKSNRELLSVIFWKSGDVLDEYDNSQVCDDLNKLLRRKGVFQKLREDYGLSATKVPPLEEVLFPELAPEDLEEEESMAQMHRFLLALQQFFLTDEDVREIEDAKVNFWLKPEASKANTVWNLASLPQQDRRDSFYYPGNDSSPVLQKASQYSLDELRVTDWGFKGADLDLLLLWSAKQRQDEARADPNRYWYVVRGSLGPLLLAWNGQVVDEDERLDFKVEFQPENSVRSAPLVISFEVPLPERPSERP